MFKKAVKMVADSAIKRARTRAERKKADRRYKVHVQTVAMRPFLSKRLEKRLSNFSAYMLSNDKRY